jgi:hypothetical protein
MEVALPPLATSGPQLPRFWSLLDETDKLGYAAMRHALSSTACKHRRHQATQINKDIIVAIRNFVIRHDTEDWKRSLICGICWIPGAIAINTRQLRLLLSKCKSSINSMFLSLGYTAVPTTSDYGTALAEALPLIKGELAELRQWSIRSLNAEDEPSQLLAPPAEIEPHRTRRKHVYNL